MSLYVIRPPDPPLGEDWRYEVPGEYIENIVSISATLTTAGGGGTMYGVTYDAGSGTCRFYKNGAPFGSSVGTGDPVATPPVQVTIAGSINGFATYDELAIFSNVLLDAQMAALYAAGVADFATWRALVLSFSPDAYYTLDPYPGDGTMVDESGSGQDISYSVTSDPNVTQVAGLVTGNRAIQNGFQYIGAGPNFGDGDGPFSIIGWIDTDATNPGQLLCNLEDSLGNGIVNFIAPNLPASPLMQLSRVLQTNPFTVQETFDSNVGQWAHHVRPSTGRTVTLQVTNGSTVVDELTGGFGAVATPGPYLYSWVRKLSANSRTADGTTSAIALPGLVLPAGYTLGTYTPDLSAGDQWSDVTIWWDSDVMDAVHPVDPYQFPPGALLEYHQRKG